jgi:hypothetical protein
MNLDVTSQLVDTALLGTVYDRARMLGRAIETARTLCHPWLDPADSFLVGRVEAGLHQGWVVLCAGERDLAATEQGRQRFEDELCRPLERACHPQRVLQEQLRLCFLDQLPAERRALLAAELRQDRRRCLVCLGTRLESLADGPERRLIQERCRLMEEETRALDQRLAALGLCPA